METAEVKQEEETKIMVREVKKIGKKRNGDTKRKSLKQGLTNANNLLYKVVTNIDI